MRRYSKDERDPIPGDHPMNFNGANECEHLRELHEPNEVEMVLGMRRLIQMYRFYCGLGYTPEECPVNARCCKHKIECDNNAMDRASIGIIEIGTHDIDVIFEDSGDHIGDDYGNFNDEDFGGEVSA